MTPTPAPKFKVGDRVKFWNDIYDTGHSEELEGIIIHENGGSYSIIAMVELQADEEEISHV